MNIKKVWPKRFISFVLAFVMVLTMIPISNMIAKAAELDTRVADPSTKDTYKEVFGIGSDTISTENAGRVWTDKSVFTEVPDEFKGLSLKEGNESFLVSLSAMASTTSVSGMSTVPTDTMIILDMSSSMYRGGEYDPSTVQSMVDAVNNTIRTLQTDNELNRVGVTIYFGGENLLNSSSTASSSKVLLPLNRYTHKDNAFLTTNKSKGLLTGIAVNSNVTIEGTTTKVSVSYSVPEIAGTYAQLGILDAMNQFLGVQDTTVKVANGEQTRVPIFVFMSDGEPTAATNEFSKKTVSRMGNNQVANRNSNETDFVTQLTAAYARKMVDEHYVDSTPLFYTLSLGTSISKEVMDPSNHTTTNINNYWNSIVNNDSVRITVQNITSTWDDKQKKSETYTVSKVNGFPSSVEQRKYVDQAFTAETADQLGEVFNTIVKEIEYQSRYFPTLVEGNEDVEGYVSFVDSIGEYMSVTDIKGLYIGGDLYSGATLSKNFVTGGGALGTKENPTSLGDELVWSVAQRAGVTNEVARTLLGLAYQHGQLSYTSDSEFSNYVGWYSDASGNYLGFWYDGIKTAAPAGATHINRSYLFLGAVDEDEGVEASDMMYATIRVREEIATGKETVAFAIPAALIPVVHYEVDLDENGEAIALTGSGAENPIRLVYEVTLDDTVNELTVHDSNVVNPDYVNAHTGKDADGNEVVYFYTNNYEVDNTTGYGKVNTYSYFRPSYENEKYYYQADAPVFADKNGTLYEGSEKPDGTYYRTYNVYEKTGNTVTTKTVYRKLSKEALATAKQASDGTWYIPDGNVHVNMDGFGLAKSDNTTATLPNADEPFVDVYGHNVNDSNHHFVVGATLGNNGRLYVKPTTGMAITKTVTEVNADEAADDTFTFTITNAGAKGVAYKLAKLEKVDGKEVITELNKGGKFDNNGVTNISLKAGETFYIYDLPAGTYKVIENENEYYIQTSVKGTASDQVTLAAGKISKVEFTNTARGEGDLTITKEIIHDLGTDYQIPDKTFEMTVTLTGAGTANKTFEAVHSGDDTVTSVMTDENGVFKVTLKHTEQITVKGLPEGATVKVVETSMEGFTASYEDSDNIEDGVVTIGKGTAVSVKVKNTYTTTDKVKVKIDLSGKKVLLGPDGKEVVPDNWDDIKKGLEFEFIIQQYIYDETNGWHWVDTETSDKVNSTTGTMIDFVADGGREITFDKVGTYNYQVVEVKHGQTDDGITYDNVMHTFSVVVTDKDMDGKLEAKVYSTHGDQWTEFEQKTDEDGNITWVNDHINFTNKYNKGETSETVMIRKNIENNTGSTVPTLSGYQFEVFKADSSYNYKETDKAENAVTVVTDGTGESYVTLNYKYDNNIGQGSKTYYYVLKEKASEVAGMKDSTAEYHFYVTVTADEEGNITSDLGWCNCDKCAKATVDGYKENDGTFDLVTFTNRYELIDVGITLDVQKNLEGREMKEGEFSFVLKDSKGKEVDTAVNGAPNSDGVAKVAFDELTFNKVGTYKYTVAETSSDDKGVTTDKTVYQVQIDVTDGGEGKLVAALSVLNAVGPTMTFNNDYKTTDTSAVIKGIKELKNKTLVNEQFTFELYEADIDANGVAVIGKTPIQTVANAADGTFTFKEITYKTAGSYKYVVCEKAESVLNGITYDKTVYLVDVTVTDDGEGKLAAKVEYSDLTAENKAGDSVEEIKFVNKYEAKPVEVEFAGTKSLTGPRDLKENEFSFNLYESNVSWEVAADAKALQTVKNDKDGAFAFAKIKYETPGTYYYVVKEASDAKIAGVVYDTNTFKIKVTVTDNNRGNLVDQVEIYDGTGESVQNISFENEYLVDSTKITLKAIKELAGKNLTGGAFVFELKDANGKVLQTKANAANGIVTFDAIEYVKNDTQNDVGTYRYTINEVLPKDATKENNYTVNGITYDTSVKEVTVEVADVDGQLVAQVDGKEVLEYTAGTFENDYNTTDATAVIRARKVLESSSDRTLGEHEFAFVLKDEQGTVLQTAYNTKEDDMNGVVAFREMTYDTPGEYVYTIHESAGNNAGMTYDDAVYKAVVTIVDDGSGKLENKSVDYYSVDGKEEVKLESLPTFTNKYNTKETSVQFSATKKLTGKELEAEMFSFQLKDADGKVLQTVKNAKDGSIEFAAIEFEKAGTYSYSVSEVKESLGGITYDDTVYKVTVKVADDGKGQLVTTIDDSALTAYNVGEFENKYETEPAKVQLDAKKTLAGRNLKEGEFTFELKDADGKVLQTKTNDADGNVVFDSIEYKETGTYKYTVSEVKGDALGVTYDTTVYDVTITVTDDRVGQLEASTVYKAGENTVQSMVFENTAKGDGALYITKEVVHELGAEHAEMKDRAFDITVTLEGEGTANATFPAEHSGNSKLTAVTTDKNGKFNITLKHNEEFEVFDLLEGTIATVSEQLDEDDKGFEAPVYTDTDNVEAEKTDGKVVVLEDATVGVTVTNTYVADEIPANISVGGTKHLVNEDNKAIDWGTEEFTFVLEKYDADTDTWVEVDKAKVNKANQTFAFDMSGEKYTEVGKYAYQVYEIKGDKTDMYYDSTYHTFHVTVADDNLDGSLEIKSIHSDHAGKDFQVNDKGVWVVAIDFTNKYTNNVPAELITDIQKIVENPSNSTLPTLAGYEFGIYTDAECTTPVTSDIKGVESVVLAPTDLAGEGKVNVVFNEANEDGYTFYIKETVGTADGMIYSTKVLKVIIAVAYGESNQLEASAKYYDAVTGEAVAPNSHGEYEFTNKYEPAPVSVDIDVNKTLTGRDLVEGEFEFVLKDAKGNKVDTAVNGKPAEQVADVVFKTLTFDKVGTYEYTVEETKGKLSGVTYDDTVYHITINVTDKGGKLAAEVIVANIINNTMTFKNSYVSEPVSVELEASKKLEGRELKAGEFIFKLVDADGRILQEKTNDADGKVVFDKIEYNTAGEYTYVVYEMAGNEAGMIYDERVYEVTVTVEDKDAELKAVTEITVNDKAADKIVFTNSYGAPDVSIHKFQSVNDGERTQKPLTVKENDIVTYYLVITSDGNRTAKDVVVTDTIPNELPALTLVEGSISNNGTVDDNGLITWELGDMEPGEEITVSFQVVVPDVEKETHWYNIGAVDYSNDPDDPNGENPPEESEEVEIVEYPDIPTSDEPEGEIPETGDHSHAGMWATLLAGAFLTIIGTIGYRRKR